MQIQEYDTVRVRALLGDAGSYDPVGANRRDSRIGDEGLVVDITPPGPCVEYIVECMAAQRCFDGRGGRLPRLRSGRRRNPPDLRRPRADHVELALGLHELPAELAFRSGLALRCAHVRFRGYRDVVFGRQRGGMPRDRRVRGSRVLPAGLGRLGPSELSRVVQARAGTESGCHRPGIASTRIRNYGCIRTPIHPAWLRRSSVKYSRYFPSSAPCHPGASAFSVRHRISGSEY